MPSRSISAQARFRDVLKLRLVIVAGDAQIDMRVRLGEALRYLRQPLRERARERDDMKRPFFQLLQVRKMRLEPALARAHFLNPREKRGASCGVCPVHCPGRTSRALPPRDDSLLGGGRRRAVPSVLQRRLVLVRRGRHLGGSRRCDACRGM